jgi:hypothetical protein
MKFGAEPKKIAVLVGLLAVALVIFLMNSSGEPAGAPEPATPSPAVATGPPGGNPAAMEAPAQAPRTRTRASTEFRPSLRPRRGDARPDPSTIDPTLRLDVMAKLQDVKVEGTRRSIFDFGQPPAPKPDPKVVAANKAPAPSPLVKPEETKPDEKADPVKPKAPPIPLKFFGYVAPSKQPARRAFFVEGDEIHIVREGEVVKKRYKIVRIGVNSVVVEDTQFGQQQTLPLEEAPPTG